MFACPFAACWPKPLWGWIERLANARRLRFLGFDPGAPTPDENTIRLYRNKLTETGTLRRVMKAFDWQLKKKGCIPIGGQIIDATLVTAPKQRNSKEEKQEIKEDKSAWEIWPDEPHKAVQKDVGARPAAFC